jgi:hypothetical protein
MARNFDKNGVLKAMMIALVATLAGLAILGWQYRQLEDKRLPALEEELERQKTEIERTTAQSALGEFMTARMEGNESLATLYLTENAVELERAGQFELLNSYNGYRVLSHEELEGGDFRFAVEVYLAERGELVEVITLRKILGSYYVDSVELAG